MDDFNIAEIGAQLDAGTFDGPIPTPNAGELTPQTLQQNATSYDPNLVVNYKASGKELAEPLSTVIQRAQRGYDYAQLVAQQKQRETELQAQQQRVADIENKWKPYHDFSAQNPEWADYVRQQWENRNTFNQAPAPIDLSPQNQAQPSMNLPPQVQQELSEMRQFIAEQKQRAQLEATAAEDQALNTEIDNVRKSFPDIDFSHTNPETGESLEAQVLRHAQQKRIYNFGAAFKDFYFDQLMSRNVMKAKEDVAKQITNQHKSGFLATSDRPLLTQDSQHSNYKNASYHQLMDVAAKELGF